MTTAETLEMARQAYYSARDASGVDVRRIGSARQAEEASRQYGYAAEYRAFVAAGMAHAPHRFEDDAAAIAAAEVAR